MLDDHEGTRTITKTPLYTFDWYIKWVASVLLMIGMVLTANNIFPVNLIFHAIGIAGWLWVGMLWNDRALIFINTFALATLTSSLAKIYIF